MTTPALKPLQQIVLDSLTREFGRWSVYPLIGHHLSVRRNDGLHVWQAISGEQAVMAFKRGEGTIEIYGAKREPFIAAMQAIYDEH